MITFTDHNNNEVQVYYVNVYDLTRNYGGPEEGGWWYDSGECIKTFEALSSEDAEKLADALSKEYPATGKRFSVLGGEDYSVVIEDMPGEDFPTHTPFYE